MAATGAAGVTTMRALLRSGGAARLGNAPRPQRPPGWARVRVLLAGICRTDLYAAEGLLPVLEPRILGHELVGEIVEVDGGCLEGSALSPGQRVTALPLLRTGASVSMLGVDLDGAFAEELVVPASLLHVVPPELELRRAAFVEPLAAALAVLKAPIRPEQRGLVLGSGRIAELTTRVLRARGFHRIEGLTVEEARAREAGHFDHVIETSADETTLAAALHAVRPGGVIVLKSRPPRAVPLDVARAVVNDVTLAAVGYAPFPEAIALACELPLDDLLGKVHPLERFALAFAQARDERASGKLFLRPRAGEER